MTALKPPIVVMFDQMVVGIARKRQGVQPKRINRPVCKFGKPRRHRHKMRQIVAQNIVPDNMCEARAG